MNIAISVTRDTAPDGSHGEWYIEFISKGPVLPGITTVPGLISIDLTQEQLDVIESGERLDKPFGKIPYRFVKEGCHDFVGS